MPRPWIAFKRIAAALLLAGAAWLGAAQAATAPAVPAPVGLVNDFANALTAEEKDTLNGIATSLEDATGAQMAFVIMPSIDPYDDFTYGMAIFNQWQLGQKGKDNGLLVLLALKEHRIRIITGYGLEAILPDGKVGRFRDEYLVPYLKENRLGEGLANLGLRFAQEVAQAEGKTLTGAAAQAPHRQSYRGGSPLVNLVALIFFVVLAIISSVINRRRGGRGGFFYGGGVNYSGGGGGFGGGFGGFGGGMSGGGGAGGSW